MATTLVLVHGGTVTSRMWAAMVPHLRTPALAVDLPGRRYRPADLGLVTRQDWIDAVRDDIVAAGLDDVVLVGHSSGGYVIPGVAALLARRVRRLVFVAATVPAEGNRPVDHLKPKLRAMTIDTESYQRERAVGRTIGGLVPGEGSIETDLEVIENPPTMGVEAPGPLFERFTWAGVPDAATVPRTYVRGLQDRVIPPDLAAELAAIAGADLVDIDAGHDAAADAPAELAAILDRLAT